MADQPVQIPDDIMKTAEAVAARIFVWRIPIFIQQIAHALLVERIRCLELANEIDQAPGDDSPMGPLMVAQVQIAQSIAAKISRGERIDSALTGIEVASAIAAERERIAAALDEEAETTPCAEDAAVVRDCARLVRADFSYEAAERLAEEADHG